MSPRDGLSDTDCRAAVQSLTDRFDLIEPDREEMARLVQSGAARVEARERARQDLAVSKRTNLNEELVAVMADMDLPAGCEWNRHRKPVAMRRRQLDRRCAPLRDALWGRAMQLARRVSINPGN